MPSSGVGHVEIGGTLRERTFAPDFWLLVQTAGLALPGQGVLGSGLSSCDRARHREEGEWHRTPNTLWV